MTHNDHIKNHALNLYLKNRQKLKQKEIEVYKGQGVVCPVCQYEFRSFAPYFGSEIIENARCPNCESMERHRLMWIYLHEKTDFFDFRPKKLLHFAPERYFYKFFNKMSKLDYVPCDLHPDKYEKNYGGEIIEADITILPFKDHEFDVIFCSHILEHVPDDNKAISELFRVMKKGGWGIIQVPIDYSLENTFEDFSITTPEERMKAFGQEDHARLYGRDYKLRLEKAGFQVIEDQYAASFSSENAKRIGILRDEVIYFCTKQ